ncbi:Phosphoadenosine phosphosulfate reductase [Favolaschia claudopus]|uniref:Phosphoadenosine phosphosulfate reductase n=1 Tax=Favolaschia claudopus TaxID=2862362 RepID=A0AAW0EDJ7_9AGAR
MNCGHSLLRTCVSKLIRRLDIRWQQPEFFGAASTRTAFPDRPQLALVPQSQSQLIMPATPDFAVDASQFPPLPIIKQEDIRTRVFTHRSYYARAAHVFEDTLDDPSPDNEKFEHLGDSVLGLIVTSLVLEMYPGLRVGPSTKVRAKIVGNATLADISVKYKLPEQLRLHPAQAVTLRASINVQADVFESFIGGLYTDQDLEACQRWLQPLFRPYAQVAYAAVRGEHGLPPLHIAAPSPDSGITGSPSSPAPSSHSSGDWNGNGGGNIGHLALFNQRLQNGEARVEWLFSDLHPFGEGPGAADVHGMGNNGSASFVGVQGNKSTPVWSAQVLVDGEVYGRGRGNTKKAAKNEAAKHGLARLGVVV